MQLLKALQRPLSMQILDLRSQVTKEAISLLVFLAENYTAEFAHNSSSYMNSEIGLEIGGGSLFKQLHNGKKVISDLANEGILKLM